MTIPTEVRSAVGLTTGDLVDVRAVGNKIIITPQVVVDRGEYTAEQRRALDASLAKSEKGPYYGPFKSGAEIAAFVKKRARGVKGAKAKKPR